MTSKVGGEFHFVIATLSPSLNLCITIPTRTISVMTNFIDKLHAVVHFYK